jgi:hypothetical protein
MARHKAPGNRKRPLGKRITHACVKCGAAVATGMLICVECIRAAGPAQAAPRPPEVVRVCPAPVSHGPLRYYTIAELAERGWLLPPIDRPENNDLPEPDATFYEGGVFAGTAATGTATGV